MRSGFITIFLKIMLLILGLFFSTHYLHAQVSRKYALSLQTDNDSYLMQGQDQYYTNGIAVEFSMPLQHMLQHVDLLGIQVGHQLFNGNLLSGQIGHNWDRPSTGRFYLNGQFQRSYAKEWLWNIKAELGLVGDAGKGREIQQFIHKTFRMYEVESWESSLQTSVGVDFEAAVLKKLWRNLGQYVDISGGAGARLGMNYSNLATQFTFRLGKLAPYMSSYLVGNAGFVNGAKEYYFYYSPGYMYQLHNITIQGELFPVQNLERYEITRHLFGQTIGFAYSHNRFAIEAAVLFNTKEGREMKGNHQYGRIKAGFRF